MNEDILQLTAMKKSQEQQRYENVSRQKEESVHCFTTPS